MIVAARLIFSSPPPNTLAMWGETKLVSTALPVMKISTPRNPHRSTWGMPMRSRNVSSALPGVGTSSLVVDAEVMSRRSFIWRDERRGEAGPLEPESAAPPSSCRGRTTLEPGRNRRQRRLLRPGRAPSRRGSLLVDEIVDHVVDVVLGDEDAVERLLLLLRFGSVGEEVVGHLDDLLGELSDRLQHRVGQFPVLDRFAGIG